MNFRSAVLGLASIIGCVSSASAQSVIYNSSSMFDVGVVDPRATAGTNGNVVSHVTFAYWAQQVGEIGGKIGFAGSDRLANSATVQMRTGLNRVCLNPPTCTVFTPAQAVAGPVTLTLNFYAINGDGSIGSLLGLRTQMFASPEAIDDTGTPFVNEGRPFYDATFDLSGLSLILPDQVYYGVVLGNPGSTATTQSTNLTLWNYGTNPAAPKATSFFDDDFIKAGTDLSNAVWVRRLNGEILNPNTAGFTPNLIVTANAVVPEPSTYALMATGLAALGAAARRRRGRTVA